jgi:hypothetical protein
MMKQQREQIAKKDCGYPQTPDSSCVLCDGAAGTIHFKGKLICESCLEVVKDRYRADD